MDVSLDDLDWCLDQIMPANPAYLMALPTKNDPMLSYLTTGFQDHVRLREKFGYKVNDRHVAVLPAARRDRRPGAADRALRRPAWVYLQYRRRKGDTRSERRSSPKARTQMDEVRGRGVFLAEGYGERAVGPGAESRSTESASIYDDAKECIWAELPRRSSPATRSRVVSQSQSGDRRGLHPASPARARCWTTLSVERVLQLRDPHDGPRSTSRSWSPMG